MSIFNVGNFNFVESNTSFLFLLLYRLIEIYRIIVNLNNKLYYFRLLLRLIVCELVITSCQKIVLSRKNVRFSGKRGLQRQLKPVFDQLPSM